MTKNIEYEGRILDIDVGAIQKSLKKLSSHPPQKFNFRRYIFDIHPATRGKWIRLRTDGKKATLTLKSINSQEIDGTEEWEVDVSDFDTTYTVLARSGLNCRSYQQNNRISYALDEGEVSIDFWPQIPPYIEIESTSTDNVEKIAKKLGFGKNQITGMNTEKIYEAYGIDISEIKELSF